MFSETNAKIVWRAYIARLILPWTKMWLSAIYCSFISFDDVRSLKTEYVFNSVIRPAFGSRVTAILVSVKDVSVTWIGFLDFYFEPKIF